MSGGELNHPDTCEVQRPEIRLATDPVIPDLTEVDVSGGRVLTAIESPKRGCALSRLDLGDGRTVWFDRGTRRSGAPASGERWLKRSAPLVPVPVEPP